MVDHRDCPDHAAAYLREMADADLDNIAALLGDEFVMLCYPRPKTRSEAQDWINWNQDLYRDHGFGLWAVLLREPVTSSATAA
jgi:RimJ/RimL family protein N-acetyltransferase